MVEAELGRGAMGVIYRAHDPAIDRKIAVKLVLASLLDAEERAEYLERFQREARAAGRCAHPNIVAVYDFAVHDDNPFIAMEFVEGANLAQLLARGRLGQRAALDIALQLLAALDCAHGFGVVHRDVKPANLMITREGRVKVTDFGISSLSSSSLTQQGTVMGTPSYMSPEQCRGDRVEAASDLFSAGALLHEMLTGDKPFPGRGFTEVAYRLVHEPAARLGADGTPALQAVLDRAMAKNAADRYPGAAAMADALRAAAGAPAGASAGPDDPTAFAPSLRARLDPARLGEIERKLAQHVGPIARHLVQSASPAASTIEALCETLSGSIRPQSARAAFLQDTLGRTAEAQAPAAASPAAATPAAAIPAAAIPPDAVDRIQRALSQHLGPIAKVLVRRALAGAATEQDLRRDLARHIDDAAARAAFLRQP